MNYREFINTLNKDELKSVYLFHGEEYYLIDDLVKRVKSSYVDERFESLNYTVLEGEDVSFEKLMNACETLPFMSDKKLVIIKDFPLLRGKKDGDEGLKGLSEAQDKKKLAKYIEELGDHICLIFVDKGQAIRKNNFLYRAIGRSGGVVELKRLRGGDLDSWIQGRFKGYNRRISRSAIGYFIEYTSYLNPKQGRTLYDLENEILKLCNYVPEGIQVTNEDMDSLMAKSLEMNVFNLLDSISRRDGQKAIRLFNEMYMSNEPVLIILHMIVRQFRNMLHIKALRMKGYMEGQINSKLGLNPYEYRKVFGQSNSFSMSQLERALFHCLEADKSIKVSMTDERLVLEILITNLCFNI